MELVWCAVLLFAFISATFDVEAATVLLERQVREVSVDTNDAKNKTKNETACELSPKELQCLRNASGSAADDYGDYDDDLSGNYEPWMDYYWYSLFNSSLGFAHLCSDSICSNVIVKEVIPKCKVNYHSLNAWYHRYLYIIH